MGIREIYSEDVEDVELRRSCEWFRGLLQFGTIGLPLARISVYHFFGGGAQISKVKVRNCSPPGGMGYPEPNFGIKDRKLGIKDLEGVRQKHQNHVKNGFECAQRLRSVLWAVFFSPAALFFWLEVWN